MTLRRQTALARNALALGLALALCSAGCAPYQVGPQSLYAPDVTTVHVPIFESLSYRRYLGERLTEAVVKEIEARTPFKVVATPAADSVLYGRIIEDTKNPLVEANTDEPRDIAISLRVQVRWVNNKGAVIRQGSTPLPPEMLTLFGDTSFAPEVGDTMAAAQQRAIHKLASRIVDLMEAPWTIPAESEILPGLPIEPLPGLPGQSLQSPLIQELPPPVR